jgi:hypothetical protein
MDKLAMNHHLLGMLDPLHDRQGVANPEAKPQDLGP